MVTKLQLGLLAFAGTVALVQGLAHLARRYGLVDIPDHRKDHARETPLVGGIAIFGGLLLAALAAEGLLVQRDALFIGLGLLLLTGMIDDRGGLTPAVRLSIQVAAALIMVLGGGVQLDNLGNLFGAGDVHLGAWSVPMTVFAVVGVINAMNMIDGADGLAGGVALIALLIFFAFFVFQRPLARHAAGAAELRGRGLHGFQCAHAVAFARGGVPGRCGQHDAGLRAGVVCGGAGFGAGRSFDVPIRRRCGVLGRFR